MTRLLSILIPFLAVLASPVLADKRVALVIGNGAYEAVPELINPRHDAEAMSAKLRRLGFDVVEGYDLGVYAMQMKVREFSRLARDADVNLFFYAGHGLGVEGKNYLVPVDARFEDAAALEFEAIEVDTVARQMQIAQGASLIFLDACRDNPMTKNVARTLGGGTRSVDVGKGLVAVEPGRTGKGMAIAFATSPGDVAYDGDGQHSPFTRALLEHIDRPNTSISEIMTYITGDVRQQTNDRQQPWLNASLTAPVVLNRIAAPVVPTEQVALNSVETAPEPPAAATSDLAAQQALYDIALKTDRIEDFQAYLDVFPNGLFAGNARSSIDRLESAQTARVESKDMDASTTRRVAEPTAPLHLQVTDSVRAMPANAATEQQLQMDRAKRREVQARLNLAGSNVGRPDGAIGPNTRRGLGEWQIRKGLQPTGYLNAAQLQILMVDTEDAWRAWSAQNPVATSRVSSTRKKKNNNGQIRIDPGAAIAVGGAAILLKKILD